MSVTAENIRTSTKAAIKRASARARATMNQLDREQLVALSNTYRDAALQIQASIRSYAGSDGSVRLEVLQQLLGQVNQKLRALSEVRDQMLDDSLVDAASIGVRPFEGAVAAGSLVNVADDAVRFVHRFVGEDGLQLSDRLWRVDAGARDLVNNAIESAVIQGHSASQAANDFLIQGQPVPADIASKIGAANADTIATAAASALLTVDDNARYHAMRVFRTEINRAHGEAYMAAAFEHPDVIGTRFLLSPAHPEPDICDMHARVNRYGLGPGVYPKGRNPWPAHPNTLSYVEVVFADEITDDDRAGKEDRIAWLKKQPPHIQESVLASRKKRAALRAGVLKEQEIATPWKVLKKKYKRKGIDVDGFAISPAAPAPGPYVPAPSTAVPVSAALRIETQRKASENVLKAIDSVHGDGALNEIPIIKKTNRQSYLGAYVRDYKGTPLRIELKQRGSHVDHTLAHEIGHFIDHNGLPGDGFTSVRSELTAEWRKAIDGTMAVKAIDDIVKINPRNRSIANYLLSREELWARSYAQWVTRKSGNPVLNTQLDDMLKQQRVGIVGKAYSQWEDDDFEPVSKAMDDIMAKMGWI